MTPTDKLKAALEASIRRHGSFKEYEQALALLDTHVLVPKEPTDEALSRLNYQRMNDGKLLLSVDTYKDVYKAMITVSEEK